MATKVKRKVKGKSPEKRIVNFKVRRYGVSPRSFNWLQTKAKRLTDGNVTELLMRAVENYMPQK